VFEAKLKSRNQPKLGALAVTFPIPEERYKVEIRRNKDNALIADAFELAAGKSISSLTLLEAPEFGNADCTVTITAFRDGKQIGTLNTELTLHTAYKNRASGARCAGKSLCGQGNSPAKTLRLRLPRLSPGGG